MARLDEQISTLQEKLEQLKLRQQRLDARKRALDAVRTRKVETRRRILLGGVMLEKLRNGELDKNLTMQWMSAALTRPADRALFELDGPPPSLPPPQASDATRGATD